MNFNFKEIINSKIFRAILTVAAGAVVLVFVFSAGVFVGIEKTKFSYGWRENYYRNFIDSKPPLMGPLDNQNPFWDKSYINPHGLLGEIISINDSGLVLQGPNSMEIPVSISGPVTIMDHRQNLKFPDLDVGMKIVVIGAPDDRGGIRAKFIRVDDGFLR
jgi:hypothetical protein